LHFSQRIGVRSINTPRAVRVDRLVYLPVLGAMIVVWITIAAFAVTERNIVIERAQTQLAVTASTLADFNELAQQSSAAAPQSGSDNRSAAIWRALLRYPTASIWVDEGGIVTAGQAPAGDLKSLLIIEDARVGFTVHAALPRADALAEWRRSAWLGGGALLTASLALRTAELNSANVHLEAELTERKAAEAALREHDVLLNVVTKGAAQLLGAQHDDAIQTVLELVGQTIAVSRVQFCEIATDNDGHLRSTILQEWCAPGIAPMIDDAAMQDLDLSACLPRAVGAAMLSGEASFFINDLTGLYFNVFERAKMRSFLRQLLGSVTFNF
jgi:hypothetical protein